MKTKKYNPLEHSVVQALMKPDATHTYEVPDYVEALLFGLKQELERVYWNWNQESLDNRDNRELLDVPGGFEYRRYYWDDDEAECAKPNLKFGRVVINWYKHMGRGMSTNCDLTERKWREWFDEAMIAIRLYDTCMQHGHQKFRDEDAGRKPFEIHERIQCRDCKYCVAFGANSLIWNRSGSRNVHDADTAHPGTREGKE